MIELKGSRFTQILPENLSRQPETRAFAYAVGRQVDQLLALSDAARVYAALGDAPEQLLDHLAAELRTPGYDGGYPLDTKRALVQSSLVFYATMGTPAAVDRILQAVFSGGSIQEWFDYGGRPHHFRVSVQIQGQTLTGEGMEQLRQSIAAVKRLSSRMEDLTTFTQLTGQPLRVGCALCGTISQTRLPLLAAERQEEQP